MNSGNGGEFCVRMADGSRITVYFENLGYCRKCKGYETNFDFGRVGLKTCFKSIYHEPFTCPTPALRLAHDMERLESAMTSYFGQPIAEIDI